MGNSFATIGSGGSPKVMLAGHIDEIGVMVTHIEDSGSAPLYRRRRLGFAGAGGQRIKLLTNSGEVTA